MTLASLAEYTQALMIAFEPTFRITPREIE
jgi:hypothetical protein